MVRKPEKVVGHPNEFEIWRASQPVDGVARSPAKKADKYKDPLNNKILRHIANEFKDVKRRKELTEDQFKAYRIGAYMGMNATLKELGRETL